MLKVGRKVFDSHFHIGPYGSQRISDHNITPIPRSMDSGHGDECVAYLRKHNITGGLIVPTYHKKQETAFEYNRIVSHAVDNHRELIGALWVSPIPEVESLNEETLRLLPHAGIRAFKLASNTWNDITVDPRSWDHRIRRNMERILETATRYKLVLHFHTGYLPAAQPLLFDAFMNEYGRSATYQLVHLGEAIAPAFDFVPRFLEWIEKGFDVYTDTSIVPGFAPDWLIRELVNRDMGCERVLFATDSPWGRFPSEYWKVEGLEIEESLKDRIFWTNAQQLYRLQ